MLKRDYRSEILGSDQNLPAMSIGLTAFGKSDI